MEYGVHEKFLVSAFFLQLAIEEKIMLQAAITDEEITSTVFPMAGWKAPGPDSLLTMFFQSNWDLVKNLVTSWVRSIFQNPATIQSMNNTFLSLIPKQDKPETFAHFRPIGLRNVIYKVVTKLIIRRLKGLVPNLISQF